MPQIFGTNATASHGRPAGRSTVYTRTTRVPLLYPLTERSTRRSCHCPRLCMWYAYVRNPAPAFVHNWAMHALATYSSEVAASSLISLYARALFSSKNFAKFFLDSQSHQIFRHMHGVLNIDENKNQLHSSIEIDETNLLSLVSPWLDNIYQIQTKVLQCQFSKKFWN